MKTLFSLFSLLSAYFLLLSSIVLCPSFVETFPLCKLSPHSLHLETMISKRKRKICLLRLCIPSDEK